jgi:hypothetical protein
MGAMQLLRLRKWNCEVALLQEWGRALKKMIMKTEIETFIAESRIKSKRRKRRFQHRGKEKELLDAWSELEELHKQRRRLGFIELEKPIVKGWKRYFVLRTDIMKSKEGRFFHQILEKINNESVCGRKDFKARDRKTKRMTPIEQHTTWLSKREFDELNFTDKQRECFEFRIVRLENAERKRLFVYRFEWQFEFKVKRNIITKISVMDPLIESRIAELENYFERNNLREKVMHLRGISRYRSWRKGWDEKEKYQYDWNEV